MGVKRLRGIFERGPDLGDLGERYEDKDDQGVPDWCGTGAKARPSMPMVTSEVVRNQVQELQKSRVAVQVSNSADNRGDRELGGPKGWPAILSTV